MKTNIYFWSYLVQFFLEWEMFQLIVLEKLKRHIFMLCSYFLNCFLLDDLEKNSRAGQATDENLAHALCVLGT